MAKKRVEINPKTCERIKIICAEQGITQAKLANMVGYTPQHITNIIKGKTGLSWDAAHLICSIFREDKYNLKYREEWLLGLDDYKSVYARADAIEQMLTLYRKRETERSDSVYKAIGLFGNVFGYDVKFYPEGMEIFVKSDEPSEIWQLDFDKNRTRDFIEDIQQYVKWRFEKFVQSSILERTEEYDEEQEYLAEQDESMLDYLDESDCDDDCIDAPLEDWRESHAQEEQ